MRNVRILIDGPRTCAELKKKVEAFKELYGREPNLYVNGTFRVLGTAPRYGGDLLFANFTRVTKVGSKLLTVRCDGRDQQINPVEPFGELHRVYFVLGDTD